VGIYDKNGSLAGGQPDKPVNVLEYLVLQRMISAPDSHWQIYGKLLAPTLAKPCFRQSSCCQCGITREVRTLFHQQPFLPVTIAM